MLERGWRGQVVGTGCEPHGDELPCSALRHAPHSRWPSAGIRDPEFGGSRLALTNGASRLNALQPPGRDPFPLAGIETRRADVTGSRRHTWLLSVVLIIAACSAPRGSTAPERKEAKVPGPTLQLTARLTIDPKPADKALQAVWLAREDGTGERFVIAYEHHAFWRPFANLSVKVSARRLQPPGRAMAAPHLEVLSLAPVDPKAHTDPAHVGRLLKLAGRFERRTGEPGSKSEGLYLAGLPRGRRWRVSPGGQAPRQRAGRSSGARRGS